MAIGTEGFAPAVDAAASLEAQLLPRVCWVAVKSAALASRVNALMCLAKIFKHLSSGAIVSKVNHNVHQMFSSSDLTAECDGVMQGALCDEDVEASVSRVNALMPRKEFHAPVLWRHR